MNEKKITITFHNDRNEPTTNVEIENATPLDMIAAADKLISMAAQKTHKTPSRWASILLEGFEMEERGYWEEKGH